MKTATTISTRRRWPDRALIGLFVLFLLLPLLDMRGIRISMAESNAVFLTPKPELPALETFVPTGEHVMDEAIAKNSHGSGLAMVHTDSFGHRWIPFLGYQFGEADFFWQYHLDGPLIERQKPVVVINEMLKRFFNVTDPR